jgi:hypothetical protein
MKGLVCVVRRVRCNPRHTRTVGADAGMRALQVSFVGCVWGRMLQALSGRPAAARGSSRPELKPSLLDRRLGR